MLHNKHKPSSFKDMIGNKEIFSTLQSYIDSGEFPHCLLFHGERGCGKSSSADIISNAIPDAKIHILDAAIDNGVAVSREIASNAGEIPLGYRNKVYILEEIMGVSDKFFDALLLVTNDPPPNTYFIIVSTEINKIRPTIKSRFVKFQFKSPSQKETRDHLKWVCEKENMDVDRSVISEVCRKNSNIVRDCLSDLTLLMGTDSTEDQLELLSHTKEDTSSTGYKIARALSGKSKWKTLSTLLKEVKQEDVEGVRRSILHHHTKELLDGNGTSALIIDSFLKEMYDTPIASLVMACYDNVEE